MRNIMHLFQSAQIRVNTRLCNKLDFRTNRKIVVFESDDWGSIRMSRRKDWEELLREGYAVDKRPYERYDTLESPSDLDALFEVLMRHKDKNGNHPVITANMLMVNPDFGRIEQSKFNEYFFEPISETYTRYYGDSQVLDIMRQGMENGIFKPQSHGREHFNVTQWLRGLQSRDQDLLTAFKHGMCGIAPKANPAVGNQLMNALRAESEEEQQKINAIISEGLLMFEQLWGFKSKSFVAPCYLWNKDAEQTLADGGVALIQTSRIGKPAYKSGTRFLYSGQKSSYGQIYSIRNCSFEPATGEGGGDVGSLITQVERAFAQNKIAVFSTHRINYVAGIDDNNRKKTLQIFNVFLSQLIRKYPDVEFMSSDQLISLFK